MNRDTAGRLEPKLKTPGTKAGRGVTWEGRGQSVAWWGRGERKLGHSGEAASTFKERSWRYPEGKEIPQ